MKFLIVFVALFALALAAPVDNKNVEIVRLVSEVGPDGFKTESELTDGSKQAAQGHLEDAGTEDEGISIKGSYSFIADDGVTYTVDYVADKNGFQPSGAHLPVAPVA